MEKEGKHYREVLAYAEEQEIDLICMGVRGAGFDLRALFGSNTDRVLRQAPCPVLIARPRAQDVLARKAA
jgi:nucleotide-binding universal stress UspA family protein